MRGRIATTIVLVCLLLLQAGCLFKPQKSKGVISYRHQKVYLAKYQYYEVGLLPEGWERMPTRARAISFYNPAARSSISTDAICSRQVQDRPLASLASDIATALEKRTISDERPFMLDGRGALRQRVTGRMDGVPMAVDMVVVRKDGCVFDFYAVTPADADDSVTGAFESFFSAFHYEG